MARRHGDSTFSSRTRAGTRHAGGFGRARLCRDLRGLCGSTRTLKTHLAVSILACDDARIAALNSEFRGKATPTKVLSWPAEERAAATPPAEMPRLPDPDLDRPAGELGDIALALRRADPRRARTEAGKPFEAFISPIFSSTVCCTCWVSIT